MLVLVAKQLQCFPTGAGTGEERVVVVTFMTSSPPAAAWGQIVPARAALCCFCLDYLGVDAARNRKSSRAPSCTVAKTCHAGGSTLSRPGSHPDSVTNNTTAHARFSVIACKESGKVSIQVHSPVDSQEALHECDCDHDHEAATCSMHGTF